MTLTIYINFLSPFPPMLHIKFGFDWPSGFRGEDVSLLWKYRGKYTCFLHTSFIKIEKIWYFSGGRQIYLTLLAWLLIQDKKSTRLNSILSSPKQLLAAIMLNKTRLNWREFIVYNLDSRSFSRKTNKNCISFQFDNDLFIFDVISAINTTSSDRVN